MSHNFCQRPVSALLSMPAAARFFLMTIGFAAVGLIVLSSSATAGSFSYAYDPAGRLTCVFDNNAGTGVNYSYDAVGNLLTIATTTGCAQNTMLKRSSSIKLASGNATTTHPKASKRISASSSYTLVSSDTRPGSRHPAQRRRRTSRHSSQSLFLSAR